MSEGDVERAKKNMSLFQELVKKRKEDEEEQLMTKFGKTKAYHRKIMLEIGEETKNRILMEIL